ARARLDPCDGGVGLDAGAETARARIAEGHASHFPLIDDHERRNVMRVLALEIERGGRLATRFVRHEYAARIQALQARSVLQRRRAPHDAAAAVGPIAGAVVCPA